MAKFTSRVRRGLAMMAGDGYTRRVEAVIADRNRLGVKRGQRYTAGQCADLRAMAAWLDEQIGEPTQEQFDEVAEAIGRRATNDPKAVTA